MIQYPELIVLAKNFGIRRVRLLRDEKIESISLIPEGLETVEHAVTTPFAFCRLHDAFIFTPEHTQPPLMLVSFHDGEADAMLITHPFETSPDWHEALRVNDSVFFSSVAFGLTVYDIKDGRFESSLLSHYDEGLHLNSLVWYKDLLWCNYQNTASKKNRKSFVVAYTVESK